MNHQCYTYWMLTANFCQTKQLTPIDIHMYYLTYTLRDGVVY